jgi:hypothetical protein
MQSLPAVIGECDELIAILVSSPRGLALQSKIKNRHSSIVNQAL